MSSSGSTRSTEQKQQQNSEEPANLEVKETKPEPKHETTVAIDPNAKYEYIIACLGAGYVGGPTMAMIALKCPTYKVIVADININRIKQWNSKHLPIYEPGLQQMLTATLGRNLFFTSDVTQAIIDAEMIFVSVNTPTKKVNIFCFYIQIIYKQTKTVWNGSWKSSRLKKLGIGRTSYC